MSVVSTPLKARSRARVHVDAWVWTAVAAVCYTLASAALLHGVLIDLQGRAPFGGTGDVAQMAWFQSWTAWAISHGRDPFVSYAVNAPRGVNIMWNTAMPLAGAVMTPVTRTFGPLVTVNVLFLLGPVTTALTARWWLSRHVHSELARFVGGAVVGFGPFVAAQFGGHLNFTVLILVPVLIRLGEDVVWRAPGRRRPAVLLGLTMAGQALLSEEVLLLVAGGAVVIALAALVCVPAIRRWPSPAVARGVGLAMLVAGLVLVWPLAVQLLGPDRVRGVNTARFFAQPRDLVVPSTHEWFGSAGETRALVARGTNAFEDGVYLGVPALGLLAATVMARRRQVWTRVGLLAGAMLVLLSFGSGAHGRLWTGLAHPIAAVLSPPVLSSIVPQRFGLPLDLLAAWWLAHLTDRAVFRLALTHAVGPTSTRRLGAVAVLAAVAAVLVSWVPAPPPGQVSVRVPRFFTSAADRVLRPGLRVILLPAPDRSGDAAMLDQAETGMRFSMLGSYAISVNDSGVVESHATPDALTVVAGRPTLAIRNSAATIRGRIAAAGVNAILLDPAHDPGGLLAAAARTVYGEPSQKIGGIDIWTITPIEREVSQPRGDSGRHGNVVAGSRTCGIRVVRWVKPGTRPI